MSRPVMRMAKVRRLVPVALLGFLVASACIEAQSGSETPVGALSTGTALQVNPFAVAVPSGMTVPTKKSSKTRSMAAGASGAPRLCFLPGIGWQSVPFSTLGDAEQASGRGASGRAATRQFTFSGTAESPFSRPSGGGQSNDTVCSGFVANTTASGLSIGNRVPPRTPLGSTDVEVPVSGTPLANSELGPAGITAPKGGMPGLSSMPSAATSILGTQSNGLKNKAYTSPFELRRMKWNAPDLPTRIKLQRQLEILAKKSTRSVDHPGKGRSMRESEKGSKGARAHRRYSEDRLDRTPRP